MNRLRDALTNDSSPTTLDLAALELARVEFPRLDIESSLARLEILAGQTDASLPTHASGREFIETVNNLLFETLLFRGNQADY